MKVADATLEQQVDQWVEAIFGSGHAVTRHLRRTLYWLEQLQPEADPALRLAALCHDVQRAEEVESGAAHGVFTSLTGEAYLAHHQRQGARMVVEFLAHAGVDEDLVRRVAELVASHEVGGDDDRNALLDADSISFFENSVGYVLEMVGPGQTAAGLREKFEWMFARIRSARARELARPLYEAAMGRLQERGGARQGDAPELRRLPGSGRMNHPPGLPISAVIWDMGGIMYRFFTELLVDQGHEQGWPLERLPLGPTGPGPDSLYTAMDRGELGEPEYVKKLVAALQEEGIGCSPYHDLDFASHDRPATWAAIERLQQAGFRQVVLTNDATRWLGERWWETWKHRSLFNAIVDVVTLGVRKPAPEPYLACARELGVLPEECLFVDDMHINCKGAEAVGMQSHRFDITDPEGSLQQVLGRLGL